ncbi:MAG: single-stranded-DNA-specific exonuclease RecJ [Syntrophaceae bacterium]|nr:single-stranded-DNA-specific exonuclease RecJ [Syntrophaceae bacterium]
MINYGILPTTQWKLSNGNPFIQDLFVKELGISPIISRILTNRDIVDINEAKKYLSPSLKDLHNPFLMKDMNKGVQRLIKAFYQNEKIVIYGDYDADGITSVVVLSKFIRRIYNNIDYYIPDRITDGYGINRKAIENMKGNGINLIITVDCGISDYDEIAFAKSIGIDTIILDHHEVPDQIPDAVAVINPHRLDCQFPFKHLAAVGIAFNFLIALRGKLREEGFFGNKEYPNLKDYLDLVALGTIGDICPLIDENRIFSKIGLELITIGERVGMKALKEIAGLENEPIDTGKASYSIIPRINAAGRIASPNDAVQLLLTDNIDEAREIAKKLDGYNRKRQIMEKIILADILDEIDKKGHHEMKGPLVFASEKWHPGIIGIVASRLVDRYYRPTILISLKDGIGKGSGRSIADFNIYDSLKECDSLLLSYGGHRFAAGISIREEDIETFKKVLDEIFNRDLESSNLQSQTNIDAQCNLDEINHDLLSQIGMLSPFGNKNPEPILCVRNVSITSPSVVGNNHLRMRVNSAGVSCNSIWFSKGQFINFLSGLSLDIAFTPQINLWNGNSDIQLKMKDISLPANPSA